jgi:glycosyltransferase involved in cell wall biosynthesis/2-polyprenyl-3-methyl-5-hydroxy-6-metoxy-1,4-benzoquinol methylase
MTAATRPVLESGPRDKDEERREGGEDLVFDGERFVPGAGVGIAYEHLSRYALAGEFAAGRDVLDIACGEGYGSAFLAARARSVTAFDASSLAITHARRVYEQSGVHYKEATIRSFFAGSADASFDLVVAFEIIEHVPLEEQAMLLDGIARVLRPEGIALVSTPNKLLYTDRPLAKNPFHVREFYREEFEAELNRRFAHVRILDQALLTGCALVSPGVEAVRAVQMSWTDLLRARGDCQPGLRTTGEYMVALLSKQPISDLPSLLLADFSRKLIAEGLQAERRTADRLARELEESRRSWEGAMAEGRHLGEALAAQMQQAGEAREQLLRAAREQADEQERVRDDLAEQLERERARAEASKEAVAMARAEAAQADRAHQLALQELAQAQGELERKRAGFEQMIADLGRLRAEFDQARRALRDLRQRAGKRRIPRLRVLIRRARARPARSWLRPRRALDKLRTLKQLARERHLLEASGLFDREFYLAEHGDVARGGMDPVEHFVRYGRHEGRDPHPLFDTSFYLETYPDVAASGVNPLVDFLLTGWKERRKPNALFDTGFYLDHNPDVAGAGVNPLVHYLEAGAAEGRDPHPDFDTRKYLADHPEAAVGGWNPLVHALRSGAALRIASAPRPAAAGEASALARWRAQIEALPRRALVVDDTLLTPDRDAGSIATLELMKTLQALGYAVTFVPHNLKHVDRYVEALEMAGFFCLTQVTLSSVHALLEAHGAIFDLVVLCRISTACHLVDQVKARCPDAVLLFETIDLHYLRVGREAALTGSEDTQRTAEATKAVELDMVRRADVTLVHSVVEREVLGREVPEAIVYHLPFVLEIQPPGRGFAERRDIIFIGGFLHRPNVDAVVHFVRDIFPLVRKELPGVRFCIVGNEPPDEVLELACADVVVTGYIERLRPVFDGCRLSVAPLRYGAGYKGKVAMSMAHGVPGVISSVAAEGMELSHGTQVLIADAPAAFAAEVVRLYREEELWERLSRASLEFAAERFSPRAARAHLAQALLAAGADMRDNLTSRDGGARNQPLQPGRALFPSRFMQQLHERAGLRFGATALVPHGVEFCHHPDAPRTDRAHLLERGALRLLIAGRVVPFKGVHVALDALPSIVEALPHLEVRLTIVGDVQDRLYLEKLHRMVAQHRLASHVYFLPPQREEDLFALFQKHDVYLFPSLFEPFALTLLLALEAGIPTVASAAGGNVDIVVDHRTGLLFPAGDTRALAEAVVELAGNPRLRRALSQSGRIAAAGYTVDAMLERIEGALCEAAGAAALGEASVHP